MSTHFYEPAAGHGLPHNPFNAIVAPRPIGWVGTVSEAGVHNLAPYSFFNAFNYTPPIVGFCSVGDKDSLKNVREVPEFSWNLATWAQREQMNASSAGLDHGTSEFEAAKIEVAEPKLICPKLVAAAPVQFECRVTQIEQLKTASGDDVPSWLILGEVVGVHIDETMLEDGIYQTARARPILRGGGPGDYFTVTDNDKFFMPRPD
ncbi:flavin reductase family protein [Novosphingopyxis sp. YJ-S2-01]|uniref:flavin reductase family protein n=1 Tax=Novosphingopyxis sp. YJ-S2-01 TaxID=2794021 RepID=UPI0018DCEC7B|nr:flavin reductase family protein [Novosphingopyxis sp. YJ-S2-01]MBH9536232.1 flavin reductase family protein [Novosphingopyxis sp. YJ-S2-01]